jgi:hypothetical protein
MTSVALRNPQTLELRAIAMKISVAAHVTDVALVDTTVRSISAYNAA